MIYKILIFFKFIKAFPKIAPNILCTNLIVLSIFSISILYLPKTSDSGAILICGALISELFFQNLSWRKILEIERDSEFNFGIPLRIGIIRETNELMLIDPKHNSTIFYGYQTIARTTKHLKKLCKGEFDNNWKEYDNRSKSIYSLMNFNPEKIYRCNYSSKKDEFLESITSEWFYQNNVKYSEKIITLIILGQAITGTIIWAYGEILYFYISIAFYIATMHCELFIN